jgi:tetratricopeptide (TPR) repeat protein
MHLAMLNNEAEGSFSRLLTNLPRPINARSMEDEGRKLRAIGLWQEGYRAHMDGDFEQAVELYTKSIELRPTAEAYTFRGWAYNQMGRTDDAISECREAIRVDRDFGNPYNDIGAYLIAKGQLDEAIEWLEKAKLARRYEPRHFPFLNLGRVFAAKGMFRRAIEEFEGALRFAPDDQFCRRALAELRGMLN